MTTNPIPALRALSAHSADPHRRAVINFVIGFVDLIGPRAATERVLCRLENPDISETLAGHYEAALAVLSPGLVKVDLPVEAERVAA